MPIKNKPIPENDQRPFGEVMSDFEALLARFDSETVDVERAIALHREATVLLSQLERRIADAEKQLNVATE